MSLIPRGSLFDVDRLFGDAWAPFAHGPSTQLAPRVDIIDKEDAYEISVELPGIDKKDVNITLHNGVLSIEAETKQEHKEEDGGKVIRQERRYGKLVRSFDLGPQVQDSDITANFENGLLKVVAPKTGQTTPAARRIEVS